MPPPPPKGDGLRLLLAIDHGGRFVCPQRTADLFGLLPGLYSGSLETLNHFFDVVVHDVLLWSRIFSGENVVVSP
jgi:hypothetical protein